MAWWVEAHWAHCGTVEQPDDGGIVYETPYADARPLLGWVLGLADEAELLEPADLRAQARAGSSTGSQRCSTRRRPSARRQVRRRAPARPRGGARPTRT